MGDDLNDFVDDRRIDVKIKTAVRMALVEEHIADHESRIKTLERFRWYLLSAVAYGGIMSTGTLALMLLKAH